MSRARELAELATGYDSGGSLNFRNRIINGDMKIYQRAQTYSGATGTGYYTADRARTSMSGAGTATVDYEVLLNQNVDGTIMNALKSVVTTTDPDRKVRYNQRIEPLNMIDMSGKAVTLSFYAKADTNLTLNEIFLSDNGTGGLTSVAFSSVNLTTSWQRFTFTATLDDLTTSSYLDVVIGLDGGTGNLTAATWYITGVQLEVGSVATPFERRPYGTELALCQSYYQQSHTGSKGSPSGRIWASTGVQGQTTTGMINATFYLPVQMRASPSITFWDGDGNSGKVTRYNPNVANNHNQTGAPSSGQKLIFLNSNSGAAASQIAAHMEFDAEL